MLHASAVRVGGKAVLFCGTSGAGKSTIAAALAQRGYPLITDDVCAIAAEGAAPLVYPDGRQLKLWAHAIERLDLAGAARRARAQPAGEILRRAARGASATAAARARSMRCARRARRTRPASSARTWSTPRSILRRNAYRPLLVRRMGQKERYFHAAADHRQRAGIFHLTRALDFAVMPQVIGWLERHWREIGLMEKAA